MGEKKPSEMSPKEAHERLRALIVERIRLAGFGALANLIGVDVIYDFPADPPERVSDGILADLVNPEHRWDSVTVKMAQELLDRRAKDKA